MQIFFLRHAKTNPFSPSGKDFDRELLPIGIQHLQELSKRLIQMNPPISLVLCSTAKRTKQTWDELNKQFPNAEVRFIQDLYLASKEEILAVMNRNDLPSHCLIIGHNDGLSDCITYLTETPMQLKTSGFCQVAFPFDNSSLISRATGTIIESWNRD